MRSSLLRKHLSVLRKLKSHTKQMMVLGLVDVTKQMMILGLVDVTRLMMASGLVDVQNLMTMQREN